ncbi:MAG: RNA-binding domain-containing protein [Candidatus Methanomethylicaceae archaeon]
MISSISISAIAHATEEPEKVKSAILNLIPKQLRSSFTVRQTSAKGHHGNPIIFFTVDIHDPKSAKEVAEFIVHSLSSIDISTIRDQISLYYDGRSSIFLRFDKQSAYLGTLRLSRSDDVVKLRISLLGADLSSVIRLFSSFHNTKNNGPQ